MKIMWIFFATLLTACAAETTDTPNTTDKEDSAIEQQADKPQLTRQDVPGSVKGREVAEVTIDEIKPAFTAETVDKLNAIVRRSLIVANEYSASVKSIRQAVDAASVDSATAAQRADADIQMAKLLSWRDDASAARIDIDEAARALKASDESYSAELLAGMVKYVHDVENALNTEISTLNAKLSAS